jgi:hypothetical protein
LRLLLRLSHARILAPGSSDFATLLKPVTCPSRRGDALSFLLQLHGDMRDPQASVHREPKFEKAFTCILLRRRAQRHFTTSFYSITKYR